MPAIDPYLLQARLEWLNRRDEWRARPAEAGFQAVAWAAVGGLALWLVIGQWDALGSALRALLEAWPWPAAIVLAITVAGAHFRSRRLQRQRWSNDWLAAQPVVEAVRVRRRRARALSRLAFELALLLPLLAAAGARPLGGWGLLIAISAALGHLLAGPVATDRPQARRREQILALRGPMSLRRWQLIEAGAILAPRRLALLLPALLLIPRGPALMAVFALLLIALLAAIAGWLRAVGVIGQAQRWLATQPYPARRWLLPALWLPIESLLLASIALGGCAWLGGSPALALLGGLGPLLLGGLFLAVAVASRRAPQRGRLRLAVHLLLLIAVAQALPPAAFLLWVLQLIFLLRNGLRE